MAVKNNTAARLRVLAAVLALGLIAGALSYRTQTLLSASAPSAPTLAVQKTAGEPISDSGSAVGVVPTALPEKSSSTEPAAPRTVSPAARVATLTQLQTVWKQSAARMKYLDHCALSGKCAGFDQSTPSSYDLDVSHQTAREIDDIAYLSKVWMQQHGGVAPDESQTIARYFLVNGNDDVKDSAIRLLDLAPASPANLQTVTSAIEHSSSGPLLKVFLQSQMVKSCADRDLASICVAFINYVAQRGSEGEQKALAKSSLSIFTPYTVQALTRFEQSESPRSQTRLNLRTNRQEFLRFQRGS